MREITKEEAEKIIKIEGEVKGEVFLTDTEYIKEKKGKESSKAIEEEMKRLGYPIDFKKIRGDDWYPIGLRILMLLVMKQVFNWGDEEIKDIAEAGPKTNFIIRLFMKYFVSRKKIFEESWMKLWPKFFSRGVPETVEYVEDGKGGYWVARIKDFPSHPIYCYYLSYYFIGIAKLIGGFKKITIQETKCPAKGDSYHEYTLKWELK